MPSSGEYDIRLVAYLPNGARLGVLTDPLEFTFNTTINDMPSLQLTYSLLGRHIEWLQVPCEVAVEYSYNGDVWTEFDNGRFLNLDDDGDALDPTGAVKYAMVGYAFCLQKALVTLSPEQRNKQDGKRNVSTQSVGQLLGNLIYECKQRSGLAGLTTNFSNTLDSSGDAWRHAQTGLSLDVGTQIWTLLKQMSDANLCDWKMVGRQLQVFNPDGELAAPRANPKAIITSNTVSIKGLIEDINGSLSQAPNGGAVTDKETADHANNVLAVAQHGTPSRSRYGYDFISAYATDWNNNPVGIYTKPSTSPDGINRGYGTYLASLVSPPRWFYAVPNNDPAERLDQVALNAFMRNQSGGLLLGETSYDYRWDNVPWSAYSKTGVELIKKGAQCVEFIAFDDAAWTRSKVIIQSIHGDNTLRGQLQAKYQKYVGTISDVPAAKISRITIPFEVRFPSALANYCKAAGIRYSRICIAASLARDPAWQDRLGSAAWQGLASTSLTTQYIRFTQPKGNPESTDPVETAAVTLRMGIDLIEAPTHGSLSDLTSRVYAYGDSFAQSVVENLDAVAPWGVWESAVAVGGVNDTATLDLQAQTLLNQGSAKRVSFTRGVSYLEALKFPGRHYDTGDYVSCQAQDGELTPMRILSQSLTVNADGLTGSLTMSDRFLPFETKVSRAVLAASGGSVAGANTAGAGVRTVNAIGDIRKASKVVF